MKATHAGLQNQDKNQHMFHIFAKIIAILPYSSASGFQGYNLRTEALWHSHILVNKDNYSRLQAKFVIICLRTATKRIPELKKYASYVVEHVQNENSDVCQ
jgi:hypothetical protein